MDVKEFVAQAKERFGKDITEEQAQAYLDGREPLPDEAIELISGGGDCTEKKHCPKCGSAVGHEHGCPYMWVPVWKW
ncbi:MAG: hypothetical protein PHI27_04220 [Eubacteriales bacterium]|nr:hypothetical protein [Eubacteriales bacterium]MDD3881442.1 hypothetical protein [Eubacteriales bacterium]